MLIDILRNALRRIRYRRRASFAACLLLAVGTALVTTVFAVVDALLVNPLPFNDAERLATIYMGNENGGRSTVSPQVLRAWREASVFAGAEGFNPNTALIERNGDLLVAAVARVTPGVFDLLGPTRPVRGVLFGSDVEAINSRIAVISESMWGRLFQRSENVVGERLSVDGEPVIVAGVVRSDFRFPQWNTEVWIQTQFANPATPTDRPMVVARFKEGMPTDDSLRSATAVARQADGTNERLVAKSRTLAGGDAVEILRGALPLLALGVFLACLVMCVNASSILLTDIASRRNEFGIATALGARPSRVLLEALVESLLLAAVAFVIGVVLATVLIRLLDVVIPESLRTISLNPLDIEGRSLLVAAGCSAVTTLASVLLPAVMAIKIGTIDCARIGTGLTEHKSNRVFSRALLIVEVAFASVLLFGSTLLVRSFVSLAQVPRGLNTDGVVVAGFTFTTPNSKDEATRRLMATAIEDNIRQLPGVQHLAWSFGLPPSGGGFTSGPWISDLGVEKEMTIETYHVGPEFFELYGIRLLRGRQFTNTDTPKNIIVSERVAALWFDQVDPIGRSLRNAQERFEIIGVAQEIRHPSLDPFKDRPEFYQPFAGVGSYAMMSIKCEPICPDPSIVRAKLGTPDQGIRVISVKVLNDDYQREFAPLRLTMFFTVAFAVIALFAAAIGIYAVLRHSVTRRQREFGLRVALGATAKDVYGLIYREVAVVVVLGLSIGASLASGLGKVIGSMRYDVALQDPINFAVVIGLLGSAAWVAAWRPSAAANRADLASLLRDE